jgi:hypothetical protein
MDRRVMKRTTQHMNKGEFKLNRRAAKRATQYID